MIIFQQQNKRPPGYRKGFQWFARLSLAALLALSITALISGCEKKKKTPILVYHGQWNSIQINNYLVKFILEKGYDIPVKLVPMTEMEMKDDLKRGDIDLVMESWKQNIADYWDDSPIKEGTIINLGVIFERSPQFFMIPGSVARKYGIKTIYDMKDHWRLFQDPDDPTKGLFINCIIGWQCHRINQIKLAAYGLTRFYNPVEPSSSFMLDGILTRAARERTPVFSYYWGPTTVEASYDWYILEEPPYSENCWRNLMNAVEDPKVKTPKEACAYDSPPIEKIAHHDLLKKYPEAVDVIRKIYIGYDRMKLALAWGEQNKSEDLSKVAVHWLKKNKQVWRDWISPAAAKKISEAINQSVPGEPDAGN